MPPPSTLPALRVDVIHPGDIGHGEFNLQPGDPRYAWHLLAEGDSWFTLAAIPSSNLLYELRLASWAQVLNLAYPGDTLGHIESLARNPDLLRHLAKRNFNTRFHALILSAGGNDLIDAAPKLIRHSAAAGSDPLRAESYVDVPALDQLMHDIRRDFASIVALRDSADSLSQGRPIITHTYDYPTPRNAPARFVGLVPFRGPWLFKAFANSGIAPVLQQDIVNLIFDRLAETVLALDSDNATSGQALAHFHVVDTRNTLVMANATECGNSNDWLNEIHPNLDGFRKIAARLSARINSLLLS